MLMMLFGITAFASGDASARSLKNKMNSVVSEFRNCDGVEVIKIGSLPLAIARTAAKF